jgi:superfamily I DNA/RNA helicase
MKPTDEQLKPLELTQQLQSLKILAYAGTGKTTTLKMISDNLHAKGKRGLYCAFNKAIADEAKSKLPSSVQCRTFHSLAYSNLPRSLTSKVNGEHMFPSMLAKQYNLREMRVAIDDDWYYKQPIHILKSLDKQIDKDNKRKFTATQQAQMINESVSTFCKTASKEIAPRHVTLPDWINKDKNIVAMLQQQFFPLVKRRWEQLIDTNNNVRIGHDIYLKVWQLSEPELNFDYILMDEAQDLDPLMASILIRQKHIAVFYVGDAQQQIYDWRGAVNAMKNLNLPEFRLTKSFRFGPQVAITASKVLNMLGEEIPLKGHDPIQSTVTFEKLACPPNAILCRTNKGAFEELIAAHRLNDGRKYAINADVKEILSFLKNAKKLMRGDDTDHPVLDNFLRWEEVQEYAELDPMNQEVSGFVRIINEFEDIDLLIQVVENSSDTTIDEADCVICTAHKSKGLEWDNVLISGDFKLGLIEGADRDVGMNHVKNTFKQTDNFKDVMPAITSAITELPDSELRLIYVAVTRAKKNLGIASLKPLFSAFDNALTEFYGVAD